MELLMGLEFRLVLLPFFFHFSCSFPTFYSPLPIPPFKFPASNSRFSNICRATLDSNPHLSFKLPVKSKKNKNHQNVMSTKKFQFVVVVNSSVLLHRLPVYTTGKKIDITVQTRTVKLS